MLMACEYTAAIQRAAQELDHPELVSVDQSAVLPKNKLVLLRDAGGVDLGVVRFDQVICWRLSKMSTAHQKRNLQAELGRIRVMKHEALFSPELMALLAGVEVEGAREVAIRLSRLADALINQAHVDDGSAAGTQAIEQEQTRMKAAGFPPVMIGVADRLAGAKAMESLADCVGHLLDVRKAQAARDLQLLSGKAVS